MKLDLGAIFRQANSRLACSRPACWPSRRFAVLALLLGIISLAQVKAPAQSSGATPPAETQEFGQDCAYVNVFAGPAAAAGGSTNRATFTGGVTFGQYFARPLGKGLIGSPQFELGLVGPLPHGHPIDGLVSVDYMFANKLPRRNLYPFITVGYTRIFATGDAANFGLGLDVQAKRSDTVVRIELRDYFLFDGPQQHVVGLRIGLGKFVPD